MLENYFLDLPLIVFSDESRFANDPDNRQHWLQSSDFREKRCARQSKYTFSTMVWGAIGLNFKSKLVFPKGKINESEYRNYLKISNIFDDADESYHGKFKWIFQQDGATPHTTEKSFEFIEDKAKILYGWPPNSPDLSPIEMVWAIMKNRLHDFNPQPTNKKQLEEALLIIWEGIDQETINNLLKCMEAAYPTCYLLEEKQFKKQIKLMKTKFLTCYQIKTISFFINKI